MPHILIADDEPQIRTLLRHMLRRAGHEVREAADGAEALRACRKGAPDLVLCDLFMPGKEGLETIRDLRHEFPGLKVVGMSGGGKFRGDLDVLRLARLMGAAATLEKPFNGEDLSGAVAAALAAPAAEPDHGGRSKGGPEWTF